MATPTVNLQRSATTTPTTTAVAKTSSALPKRSALKKKAIAQHAIAATQVTFEGCDIAIDRLAARSAAAIARSTSAAGFRDPALIISARTTATIAIRVASPEPTATRDAWRVSVSLVAQRAGREALAAGTSPP